MILEASLIAFCCGLWIGVFMGMFCAPDRRAASADAMGRRTGEAWIICPTGHPLSASARSPGHAWTHDRGGAWRRNERLVRIPFPGRRARLSDAPPDRIRVKPPIEGVDPFKVAVSRKR